MQRTRCLPSILVFLDLIEGGDLFSGILLNPEYGLNWLVLLVLLPNKVCGLKEGENGE